MINKVNYIKTVYRPYPPLMASAMLTALSNGSYNIPFVNNKLFTKNIILSDGYWYYSKTEFNKSAEYLLSYLRKPENLSSVWLKLRNKEEQLLDSTIKSANEFLHNWISYVPAIMIAWAEEDLLIKELNRVLKVICSPSHLEKLIYDISYPLNDNIYREIDIDLIKTKDMHDHVKKYRWCMSRYGSRVEYALKDAKLRYSKLDKSNYLREIKNQKLITQKAILESKELLKGDAGLIDLIQFIVYYRTHRTDMLNRSLFLAIPTMERWANDHGISYEELCNCSYEEFLASNINLNNIKQRTRRYSILSINGKISIISGIKCNQIHDLLIDNLSYGNYLNGQSAYNGKATGVVKIIMSALDGDKLKEGDILVANMTTPNMISLMGKSAALVTNEGGITCHAAIIARELKKPCIIGTKIATQVFKNGDIVEVETNKEIVRKI